MNIQYVSLTGADDKISIESLRQLSQQYPLVEWAILMFPEREGLARNPSKVWRERLYQEKLPQTALHLCGSAINRFAEKNSELLKEIEQFKRVQINLKPQWATPELTQDLVKVVELFPQIEFITQYNEANKDYFKYWTEVKNHAYLFDGSLGKGVSPEQWQAPILGKRCGYAGGLNPDNLQQEMNKIAQVTKGQTIWIDMETGLRTKDEFDLIKVEKVLKLTHQ